MREELLGYVLGALEPEEERVVENRLEAEPELRNELETVRRLVKPLTWDDVAIEPPAALADRTCELIEERHAEEAATFPSPLLGPHWGTAEAFSFVGLAAMLPW